MKDNYPFTREELDIAYHTSVVDLAQQYGYQLKDENKVYRVCGNAGLFLWKDGLGWYHGSTEDKGNNVDFLIKYCDVRSKSEAINILLDYAHITPSATIHNVPKEDNIPKELKLPEKALKYSHLYAYLINTRKIDKDIVYLFTKNKMLYEDIHKNVVFVGYDENNKASYGAVRGTGYQQYRGDCSGSDKSIGFIYKGTSNTLYVFEAPIDLMSHMTILKMKGLDFLKDNRIALGGLSDVALDRYLLSHNNIKTINFCLDNDYKDEVNHGQEAIKRMGTKYKDQGYNIVATIPKAPCKDINERLLQMCEEQELINQSELEMSG